MAKQNCRDHKSGKQNEWKIENRSIWSFKLGRVIKVRGCKDRPDHNVEEENKTGEVPNYGSDSVIDFLADRNSAANGAVIPVRIS